MAEIFIADLMVPGPGWLWHLAAAGCRVSQRARSLVTALHDFTFLMYQGRSEPATAETLTGVIESPTGLGFG